MLDVYAVAKLHLRIGCNLRILNTELLSRRPFCFDGRRGEMIGGDHIDCSFKEPPKYWIIRCGECPFGVLLIAWVIRRLYCIIEVRNCRLRCNIVRLLEVWMRKIESVWYWWDPRARCVRLCHGGEWSMLVIMNGSKRSCLLKEVKALVVREAKQVVWEWECRRYTCKDLR